MFSVYDDPAALARPVEATLLLSALSWENLFFALDMFLQRARDPNCDIPGAADLVVDLCRTRRLLVTALGMEEAPAPTPALDPVPAPVPAPASARRANNGFLADVTERFDWPVPGQGRGNGAA